MKFLNVYLTSCRFILLAIPSLHFRTPPCHIWMQCLSINMATKPWIWSLYVKKKYWQTSIKFVTGSRKYDMFYNFFDKLVITTQCSRNTLKSWQAYALRWQLVTRDDTMQSKREGLSWKWFPGYFVKSTNELYIFLS